MGPRRLMVGNGSGPMVVVPTYRGPVNPVPFEPAVRPDPIHSAGGVSNPESGSSRVVVRPIGNPCRKTRARNRAAGLLSRARVCVGNRTFIDHTEAFALKIKSLEELFIHELKDLYDAEHQLVEALPKMAEAATDPNLKAAFEKHLKETRTQVVRLKGVFEEIDETPKRETCDGMKGLLEEAEKVMEEVEDDAVLDAALIASAQKVEHYEIATYGALIAWARNAGLAPVELLLEQSMAEEKTADEKLTQLAVDEVNVKAEAGEEEAEEEGNRPAARSGASRRRPPTRSRAKR